MGLITICCLWNSIRKGLWVSYIIRFSYSITIEINYTIPIRWILHDTEARCLFEKEAKNKCSHPLQQILRKAPTSLHISVCYICKSKCTGKCRCIKNNLKCSIYCHTKHTLPEGHDGGNLLSCSHTCFPAPNHTCFPTSNQSWIYAEYIHHWTTTKCTTGCSRQIPYWLNWYSSYWITLPG